MSPNPRNPLGHIDSNRCPVPVSQTFKLLLQTRYWCFNYRVTTTARQNPKPPVPAESFFCCIFVSSASGTHPVFLSQSLQIPPQQYLPPIFAFQDSMGSALDLGFAQDTLHTLSALIDARSNYNNADASCVAFTKPGDICTDKSAIESIETDLRPASLAPKRRTLEMTQGIYMSAPSLSNNPFTACLCPPQTVQEVVLRFVRSQCIRWDPSTNPIELMNLVSLLATWLLGQDDSNERLSDTVVYPHRPMKVANIQGHFSYSSRPILPPLRKSSMITSVSSAEKESNDPGSIRPIQPELESLMPPSPTPRSLKDPSATLVATTESSNVGWRPFLPQHSGITNFQAMPSTNSGIRKKSLLVSRIRKVFIKPGMNGSSTKESSDISPRQQGYSETKSNESSLDQHRGSLSSSSSGETMSVGQADLGLFTPSTSPEISPTASPNLGRTSPSSLSRGSSSTTLESNNANIPGKPLRLETATSRITKKRLSFASITAFFNPRSSEAAAAMAVKRKEHRSSSVPNIENPMTVTERHFTSFQRRHSLNAIPNFEAKVENQQPDSPQTSNVTPWVHHQVLPQSPAGDIELSLGRRRTEVVPDQSTKKSKIYGLFGKQCKKQIKSKEGPLPGAIDRLDSSSVMARHLRPASIIRQQQLPSIRSSSPRSSIYAQVPEPGFSQEYYQFPRPVSVDVKRLSQTESSFPDLSSDIGRTSSRVPEEQRSGQRVAGPTRHRRQSSIAGRHASQQGHYPMMDRKQRLSFRRSITEDDPWFAELFSHEPSIQQPWGCPPPNPFQGRYSHSQHGESGTGMPMKPRVTPISTSPTFASSTTSDLTNIALPPMSSRGNSFPSIPATNGLFSVPYQSGDDSDAFNSRPNSIIDTPMDYAAMIENPSYSKATPPRISGTSVLPFVNSTMTSSQHQYQEYQQQQEQQQQQREKFQVHQLFHAQQQQLYRRQQHPQSYPSQHLQRNHQQSQQHTQHHPQQHLLQGQFQGNLLDQSQTQPLTKPYPRQQQFMHTSPSPPLSQDPYGPYSHQFEYNPPQPILSHISYPSSQLPASCHPPQAPSQLQHSEQAIPIRDVVMSDVLPVRSSGKRCRSATPHDFSAESPKPPGRQIQFSSQRPMVYITWAPEQYDRTSDPNITAHKLTPTIAQQIKTELNQFKSQEMIVHQDSREYTHFFV